MNDRKVILGVIIMVTLGTTTAIALSQQQQEVQAITTMGEPGRKAPIAISGDNIYVTWWSNKTGNDEVLFRASTDKGQTFGDKINLSNTTDVDSIDAEISADANTVAVTWWERTNQTSNVPVMKVSNDNGKTFGALLKLAANGTIGGE